MTRMLRAAALAAGVLLSAHDAGAAVPEGIWLIPGKVAVRVFDCSGLLCGSVVWLRDSALRTPALCRRTIIWGLRPDGENNWSGGWFFDPENGKTYDLSAELVSADRMTAQVYFGVQLFGRTETLRRTTIGELPGAC